MLAFVLEVCEMFLLTDADPLSIFFTALSSGAFVGVFVAVFVAVQKMTDSYFQREKVRELVLKKFANGDEEIILKGHTFKEESLIIKQLLLRNPPKRPLPVKQIEDTKEEKD